MYITIKDNRLHLEPRTNYPLHPNSSTDIFLSSLSEAKGRKSIAIILSGIGSDGSKGASAIKAVAGLVIVQTPDCCKQSSMPLNAIKTGSVDHILLPEDMPTIVLGYIHANLNNG
jgi:two-component system CheB/CheR fusion protein